MGGRPTNGELETGQQGAERARAEDQPNDGFQAIGAEHFGSHRDQRVTLQDSDLRPSSSRRCILERKSN